MAVSFDFTAFQGDLGTSFTYKSSIAGNTVTLSGLSSLGIPVQLFGKNQGVGLASNPDGSNELYSGASIKVDLTALSTATLTAGDIGITVTYPSPPSSGSGFFVSGSSLTGTARNVILSHDSTANYGLATDLGANTFGSTCNSAIYLRAVNSSAGILLTTMTAS